MAERQLTMASNNFYGGYIDQPRNADGNQLAPPSINVRINEAGEACTRPGYEDTGINLGIGDKKCTQHHMRRFNITFFAGGTKLVYVDHNNSDEVIDTGVSLTDGTVTRFADYAGMLFFTNQTDGLQMLHVMKLNGAVSASDPTITVDLDSAVKLSRFGDTTDDLRIQGTNEAYNAVNTSTGALTLVGTASQAYDNDRIAIVHEDVSSGIPKFSKIEFWQEAMYGIGATEQDADASSDVPPSVLYFGQFVTAATIENIIDFSGGLSGTELVGKSGKLNNIIATNDFLYLFKEDSTYYIKVSDINRSTGARPPQPLQDLNGNTAGYGCLNEDCAAHMGNGEIGMITNNKRAVRIKLSTPDGAAVVFPDETWDYPVQNLIRQMDDTQVTPHFFYDTTERNAELEVTLDGIRTTLIYNNVPVIKNGQILSVGRWLPPDTNKSFSGKHMRGGRLYGTELETDTLHLINEGTDDDGIEIDCVMATGIKEVGGDDGRTFARWNNIEISGAMTQLAEITVETPVGNGDANQKTFDSTNVSFENSQAIGQIQMGDTTIGGGDGATNFGDWDKRFGVYPKFGPSLQIILSSFKLGSAFKWYSYKIEAGALTKSILTTQ